MIPSTTRPDSGILPKAELLLSADISGSEGVVAALADAGVTTVFGMPGGYTGSIFAALYQHSTIRVVQVREEGIGSIAAEAAGRLTGEPVVVMGQGEWIAGNAGQGLLEGLLGSSPVIALTEMSEGGSFSHHGYYQSGSGDYGSWDAKKALEAVTKRTFVAQDAVQAVQMTQLAIKHAVSGTPGPVAVVFTNRSLAGTVGPNTTPHVYSSKHYLAARPASNELAVARVTDILNRAERPVVIAGNGVRLAAATAELAGVAERLGAFVATTAGGKGVYNETGPLALGVMGTFGTPRANSVIAESDVILAVGTRLAPIDTADESPNLIDPTRQTLIQIDIEPLNTAWTYPTAVSLLGDAREVLSQLAEALPAQRDPWSPLDAPRDLAFESERALSSDVPFHPQAVIRILQEEWPADGVVTNDAGENRLFMLHWFKSGGTGGYLMPAGGGGMGYALPAALGAKVVAPDRPVIAVCGDGGFAVSASALMTAAQENVPIVALVLNNAALGWVVHGMGEKAVAAHFMDFDHAEIARSMGCVGVRVSSPDELRKALINARSTDRPLVIDVPINLETSFRDIVQSVSGSRWKEGE
jgi:acetolactate synthase-1/2/3 large subunit